MAGTVTFDEIDRAMEVAEQAERLQTLLRWMLLQGQTQMPTSLDTWTHWISEYHRSHGLEWTESLLVPGPGEMVRVHPPGRNPQAKATSTPLSFEYVHRGSGVEQRSGAGSDSDDDPLLDLIMSESEEED